LFLLSESIHPQKKDILPLIEWLQLLVFMLA
jgi:hypothetical protein